MFLSFLCAIFFLIFRFSFILNNASSFIELHMESLSFLKDFENRNSRVCVCVYAFVDFVRTKYIFGDTK